MAEENEEISEVEMLLKKGDAVTDVKPPMAISSTNYSAGPSKTCNTHGLSSEGLIEILVQELDALPGEPHVTRPVTIFRVPIYHNSIKDMIQPKMVSIGPYHRGKRSLQTMEKHKRWYLRDFLARKPEIGMGVYLEAMRAMEMQSRQCYDDVVEMSSDEFALMLLFDGCFILEYFLKCEDNVIDRVTDVGWEKLSIDFLMIQNQIPYSVIHKLGSIFYGTVDHDCKDKCPVRTFVYERMVYRNLLLGPPKLSCEEVNHLLHLYQLRIIPSIDMEQTGNLDEASNNLDQARNLDQASIDMEQISNPDQANNLDQASNLANSQSLSMKACCLFMLWFKSLSLCLSWIWSKLGLRPRDVNLSRIPSATELQRAGVTFKEKIHASHIFDITFKNGVMEIPKLYATDVVKYLFTNTLLYEQSQRIISGSSMILTSYLMLMDFLMDTSDDVAILTRCGCIGNLMPNDEEVASFFNNLCAYTIVEDRNNHYAKLCDKMLIYINQPWHRYRAMLVRDYFSNPWVILSFLAAILLLLLTITQTGFSIYPVVHPN